MMVISAQGTKNPKPKKNMRFAVMHNLYFYNTLMARIRAAIEAGEYEAFRKTYTTMLDTRI